MEDALQAVEDLMATADADELEASSGGTMPDGQMDGPGEAPPVSAASFSSSVVAVVSADLENRGADDEAQRGWAQHGILHTRADWGARVVPPVQRWKFLHAGAGPATRGRHTVGVDKRRGMLVVFGGQNYDLRCKYNDVALYDLNADKWHAVTEHNSVEAKSIPCARSSHASVATEDALYIFGGATGKSFMASPGCCKDAYTWRYDFAAQTWSKVIADKLDAVSARYGHTAVLGPNNVVYLFGGMTHAGCDINTFKLDLNANTVEQLECRFRGTEGDEVGMCDAEALGDQGEEAWDAPRTAKQVRDCVRGFGHTAIYNHHTHSMYVFGGTYEGSRYRATFLRLDLATCTWTVEQSVNQPPAGRYVHCASFDANRNTMYIFGGYCGQYRNDVHEFDFNTKKWTEVKSNIPSMEGPCLRSGACSVVCNDHFYVFGGCDDHRYVNVSISAPPSCRATTGTITTCGNCGCGTTQSA